VLETLAELGQLALRASSAPEVLLNAVERLHALGVTPGAGFLIFPGEDGKAVEPLVETVGDLDEDECRKAIETVVLGSDNGSPGSVVREGKDGAEAIWAFPIGRGSPPSGGIAVVLPSGVLPDGPAVQLVASVTGIVSAGLALRGGLEGEGFAAPGARVLMSSLPDPALLVGQEGTILDVSESVLRMLRRKEADLLGRKLVSLATGKDEDRLGAALARAAEEGSFEETVAVEIGGGVRKINLHGREIAGGEMLVLLRDHTRYAARDRGRRILLDFAPRIATATGIDELWSRVWEAIRELLPRAGGFRVYRGNEAAVRLVWSSDLPPETNLVFTVRGWGPKLLAMLEDPDQLEAFLDRFGSGTSGTRGRLLRFVAGRGNPLLLDDPDTQLRAFVNEEELEKIRKSRSWDAAPGQEILCPLVVDGRLDLVALVATPPGERPFTWDDAADVWQLVVLAREVMVRQESEGLIDQYRSLARLYRKTLLGMARAEDLDSLYSEVGGDLLRGTEANGIAVFSGRRTGEVEWSRGLGQETLDELRRVVEEMLRRAGTPPEPFFLASAGADEVVAELGATLRGIEAMAVVPAYLGGMRLATLVLTWPSPRDFNPAERALVEFLGVGFALALSNHHLAGRLGVLRDRVRRIAGVVDQGLLEVDGSGRIRFINPLAVRLLGITDVEARRKALLGVVGPQLQEQLVPILEQVLQGREIPSSTLLAGGRKLRLRVVLEDQGDSRPDGPISTWSITEESEAEQRRIRLERVFSSSSEMIVDLAPDGTVLGANPSARRFLEQVGAVTGEGDRKGPFPKAVWRVLGREDLEVLRGGATVHKSGELHRPGGLPLAWEAEFQSLDPGGELRILAIVRDRTERQALAAARETLQRVGDALLGLQDSITQLSEVLGRGHDLATAVMVQTAAAKGKPDDYASLSLAVNAISDSAEKLAREASEDRRVIVEIEAQLNVLRESLLGVVGLAGRSAWVITDRPWRAEAMVQELERVGWSCRAALPNDPLTQNDLPEPRVVVLDVGSLTTAVSLYGRIRGSHPTAGILLAAPLGGAAGGDLSEDPFLRIVDTIPTGPELQELLNQLAYSATGGSPEG